MDQQAEQLEKLAVKYRSGKTMSYAFRMEQLSNLKKAILDFEEPLHKALYDDLKKSPEECWITETGIVIAGINHAMRNLEKWMKPRRVRTNLLNLPSSSFIYTEPLGVVLIIGPWNYPFHLLFMPLIGAMAAGNCAVVKPSEFAPHTAAVMKELVATCFSPEYIFFAEGDGAEVIPSMMEKFTFNHVFFTGSPAVGKKIYKMAAEKLVPVTLELGGKSPCVVEKDATIRIAAKRIAVSKFSNAGQMCVAPDYILVHEEKKEELIRELVRCIKEFYSDDPSVSYHFGKIINEKQFNRIVNYFDNASISFGGESNKVQRYISPTIIDDVTMKDTIMQEEIFGPVLPIITYSDFEDAKKKIMQHPDPLAFYIFTGDRKNEEKWLRNIPFGGGCVNNVSWHLTNPNLPFGGRGQSGIGSYHGKFSYDVFSHSKAVMKTPTWFDPSMKYPPFKGKLNLFKKMIH